MDPASRLRHAVEISIIPSWAEGGGGGFDSPISTGSMTIPCCCTNADISIGVDECVKEKEKLFKVFICIFFIFMIIGDSIILKIICSL